MKRPTFLEGIGVAAGASVFAAITFAALTAVFGSSLVLRLIVTAIALAYILYLLRRSPERIGRTTTLAVWAAVTAVAWYALPLPLFVAAQLGLVWLTRSLYFYASILSALADLGLVAFGLAAAIWALGTTNSLLAGVWSFFLVQALFAAIPAHLGARRPSASALPDDRFARAHRVAEAAVRRLSSSH